jgi:hypothetical protein
MYKKAPFLLALAECNIVTIVVSGIHLQMVKKHIYV